jgi:hypothetical protein
MSVTSPAKEALVEFEQKNELTLYPSFSNREPDYEAKLEVGEASFPSDIAYVAISETFPGALSGQFSCVHLNAKEALSLACWLMDWAREHMVDLPVGDETMSPYPIEAPGHTDLMVSPEAIDEELEEMYCQVCGQTLVNGQCPEDKFLIKAAPLHFPVSEPVQQAVDFECPCKACRDWRMSH